MDCLGADASQRRVHGEGPNLGNTSTHTQLRNSPAHTVPPPPFGSSNLRFRHNIRVGGRGTWLVWVSQGNCGPSHHPGGRAPRRCSAAVPAAHGCAPGGLGVCPGVHSPSPLCFPRFPFATSTSITFACVLGWGGVGARSLQELVSTSFCCSLKVSL